MSGHREREHPSASIRYGTFDQYLEAQQQYAWLFCHTLCSIKFQDLVDAIKEGRDISISDGSHKNKWGTTSWRIISDTNEADQWEGLHVTPVRKDDQYAFRSEIWGLYAMAVAIKLLCKFFHISNGPMSFRSDCEVALYCIFDWNKKAVKLLPLPQPPVRARTDARTNPSAQRATQLRSVPARVYAVSIQNQITTTVP
jgi:hypothetical protein